MSLRRDAGHFLVEAMAGCAILGVTLTTAMVAGARFQHDIGVASADQHAWQLLRERYEMQRAAPFESADWAVTATRTGTYAVPGEAPWTWTVDVTDVTDGLIGGPLAGQSLVYRQAVVRVIYRGQTISLEAVRW